MKRAHWFTRLRVAFRVWQLRREISRLGRWLEAHYLQGRPINGRRVLSVCKRYNDADTELHALTSGDKA